MITVKDFMETVDFKITEGSEFCWNCFGPNAYRLDSWNQEHDGHTVSIVFDTRTHEVYEAYAYDYSRNRAYRLVNPEYKSAQEREAQERDIDINEAWDDVRYVDLDVDEDFLEKAQAIVAGDDYDDRVSIPLNMDRDELLFIFQAAHKRDMTFNQFVEEAIKEAIADYKRDPEEFKRRFNLPVIQDPPFPPDNFTREEAREAVRKAQKKLKKKKSG